MSGSPSKNPLDVKAIFNLARQIENSEARALFLEQVTQGNVEIADRVTALLKGLHQESSFLESPPAALVATLVEPTVVTDSLGTMIGPYKLREVLGEGGMGIVYVAEQEKQIRRKVALKIIKPGMDTREVIARFEAERQALALMDHPNIAKVLDAGTTGEGKDSGFRIQDSGDRRIPPLSKGGAGGVALRGENATLANTHLADSPLNPESRILNPLPTGRPYFVMELVRGLAITEYCDRRKLSPRERIRLFITVCEAVQHAHQRGIIHRDLKPSNVMITLLGETAVPKVIDFGVAKALNQKLTEHTLYTRHAQMVGTPLYMSPEQAELSGLDVDGRSDVYSLGVLLYELLTGHTPVDNATLAKVSYDEMRRMIREDEPKRPSHRISTLAAESRSTISGQRGLDDRQLTRELRGELDWIVMKALEKDRTRRYGSADALAADLQRYLDDQPVEACPPSFAYRARKLARRKRNALTMTAILAVFTPLAAFGVYTLFRGPDAAPQLPTNPPSPGPAPVARAPGRQLPGLVPEPLLLPEIGRWQLITKKPRGVMRSAAYSPDEKFLALAEANHVRIYDASNLQVLHVLVAHSQPVRSVAWHPSGQRLASADEDGTVRYWTTAGVPTHLLEGHSGTVYQVAWHPDGEQLASAGADGTVRLWNADGELLRSFDEGDRHVFGIDWSPDGKLLASVGGDIRSPGPDEDPGDNSLRLWDPETGAVVRRIRNDVKHSALCVDWRPDGKQLAVGYGGVYRTTRGITDSTTSPAAGAGVRVWNLDGTPGAALIRETDSDPASEVGTVNAIAWDLKGERIAFGGRVGDLRIWNDNERRFVKTDAGHKVDVFSVFWKRDGSEVVTTSRNLVTAWSVASKQVAVLVTGPGALLNYAFWSDDGQKVATALNGGGTRFWDADGKPEKEPNRPTGGGAAWWDRPNETRRRGGTRPAILEGTVAGMRRWAWSKNGWLAGTRWDSLLRIWDDQGKLIGPLHGHRGGVEAVSWSPDGEWLVSGGGDSVRVWKKDGTPGPVMTGHTDEVYAVAWSPDGQWIASGATDSTIRLWKPDGTAGPIFRGHQGGIHDVVWSPDSKRLVSVGWLDNTLRMWNVESEKTEWQVLQLAGDISITLSPTGQALHGDRMILESELSYLVERSDGTTEIVGFDEFRKRHADRLVEREKGILDDLITKEKWNLAEASFAELMTFEPIVGAETKLKIVKVGSNLAARLCYDRFARSGEVMQQVVGIGERLIAESPDDLKFQRELSSVIHTYGASCANASHYTEATAMFTRYIEMRETMYTREPKDRLRDQISLGYAYRAAVQKEPRDASRDFTRCLESDPENTLFTLNFQEWCDRLIDAAMDRNSPNAADRDLAVANLPMIKSLIEEAVRRWPEMKEQQFLGNCLSSSPEGFRHPDLAIQLLRPSATLENGNWQFAWALYHAGDWDACLSALGKTDDGCSQLIAAMVHWRRENHEEALRLFGTANNELPKWYKKVEEDRLKLGTLWMPSGSTAKRLHAEAAELLGVSVTHSPSDDSRPAAVRLPEADES